MILGKGPTQELDDFKLTAKKKYYVIFTEQQNKFWLSFHYNKMNSLLCDFNSATTCNWNQKCNSAKCQYECKSITSAKNFIVGFVFVRVVGI